MKKVMLKTTLSLAVGLASTQLFASGYALNEQSISGMGTGFAGRSSSADDASTVYGNPAGMSFLKREQATVGAAAIIARSDIEGSGTNAIGQPINGSTDGDMVPVVAVPMGYYVKPVDEHLTVGIDMYAPFGLVTDYERGFAGRYWGDKSKVEVITLQPTIAWRFNDVVSIGIGPTINKIKGELGSSTFGGAAGDGRVKIKGDDTAVGFNAGVMVQATDATRIGLTYHSRVKYKLQGNTRIFGQGFGPFNGSKFDATLEIETPESADLSITHKLDNQWTIYAGSTYTRWSRLEQITVINEGVPARLGGAAGPIGTINEDQKWHNTWAHAIGASYQVNNQWVLRAGLSMDQSPANNVDRSPRIPTGDRKAVSIGAGWSPTDDLTIDAALSYLQEEEVNINLASASKGSFNAKYENSAFGLGLGMTYRF
ncbi:OmpP1/FadL family transporter [Pseudomonas sp. R5(2019)]|uniref:OmpP1/FadL family transporter n=1 Tax=Pseudomonas sp. R5(2019) TaxID=2697566 RepID=UPI00141353F1|nr:outer membrane protein transport protein [Pseudomonas sp. R5(2019)]NBA97778.1 transporter [Pseudomonas sp. R5(2019)]